MFDLSPNLLGIIFSILGLFFFLVALFVLGLMPRFRLSTTTDPAPPTVHLPTHNEAVLLIQTGGRVAYLNQHARELFNVWEEQPNLESLARRTRPSETFLSLCAGEGYARFSLNGRLVEGTSYFTLLGSGNGSNSKSAILLSLHRPQLMIESDSTTELGRDTKKTDQSKQGGSDFSNQALAIFTDLNQAMASSLELETAAQIILESVDQLIPSDLLELNIWDEDHQHLVPYRIVGLPDLDQHLEKASERYQADQGYSGYLITNRTSLLVKDIATFRQVRPALDRNQFPFMSYLGVPLQIASVLIGTLELASLSKNSYSENDLQILELLSGQAAVALNNALLYRKEQRRAIELAGLANLAQAVTAIQDPQDLYSRLIESIAPLMEVDVLGFLIYDERRQVLTGQIPFQGIPQSVIEWAQSTIQPGSPAEAIWQSGDAMIMTDAPEDPRLQALGLHHLAFAAGIHHTILAPLKSGGRMLGYIQVANKKDGSPFDQRDLGMLAIITGQAAPIIENATLIQQSRRRAQRAETLRRIASLTSSTATLEEILKYSIIDIARLLQADMAAVFLLDETRGELRVHASSVFGVNSETISRLGRISMDAPEFQSTVTGSKQPYLSADLSESDQVLPLYQPLVDQLRIHSAIDVPLISRERGIGELMVGSFQTSFFTHDDVQTVAIAAGQMAAAIEQSVLYSQTDQNLRQRVEQLTSLTRISRELNTTLLLENLLPRVYDEIIRTTNADCGTILILDTESSLDYSNSEADDSTHQDKMPQPPVLLFAGESPGQELLPLEKIVLETGDPLIINDFSQLSPAEDNSHAADTNSLTSPELKTTQSLGQNVGPAHDGILSALITPIAYQGQIAGLIHLHSKKANSFGQTEREICEALAIQTAIALGNAQRYKEQIYRNELLNRRVETLSRLFEVSDTLQSEPATEKALEAIAYAIQATTSFDVVLISLYDKELGCLISSTGAGVPLATMEELRKQPQSWEDVEGLFQPEFRIGNIYFLPHEDLSGKLEKIRLQQNFSISDSLQSDDQWHAEDKLIAPLLSSEGAPLGLIKLDAPRNNLRPDRPSLEALEIFCSQASLLIESRNTIQELETQVQLINDELLQRQQELQKTQEIIPAMQRTQQEQNQVIQDLGERSRRIRAGLDIAQTISQRATQIDVFTAIGQETLSRLGFDAVLIATPSDGGPNLAYITGLISQEINPQALMGQRNPIRHCLSSGDLLLVSNLDEALDWQNSPLLTALEAKSFVCVPIADINQDTKSASQGERSLVLAAVLGVRKTPTAPYDADDEQLYSLIAHQAASALENLDLLDETSHRLREVNLLLNFSRQLGSLDPDSILQTLVDSVLRAVPVAQTAMIVIWDAQQQLLIPRSAAGYTNPDSLMKVCYQIGEGIPGQVFERRQALRLDEVNFAKHYNLTPDNLLNYRNATDGRLPVSSIAVPITASTTASLNGGADIISPIQAPLPTEDVRTTPLGVLILDNAHTTGIFSEDDLAVMLSLAQQTALTLENARLYQASEHRSSQLQALTDVASTISSSLQPEELISQLLTQLKAILPYDTGTLWLREESEPLRHGQSRPDRMIVRAASGFEDSDQRIGLAVDLQDSQLLSEMIETSKPIWVANISKDQRFQTMAFLEDDNTPSTGVGYERLSWLGVPLIASGKVIGVIALEKSEPNFYSADDIQVATTFAGQAAIGLENALLYQESVTRAYELDQQSQTLATLNRLSIALSSSLEATSIIDAAIEEFAHVIPCTSISVLLSDRSAEEFFANEQTDDTEKSLAHLILQAEYPKDRLRNGSPYSQGSVLPGSKLFERLRETQGVFSTEDIHNEPELDSLKDYFSTHNTHSLLVIPITSGAATAVDAEQQFHGLILAHNEQHYRFTPEELELARTITNQIAISLQNATLYEETRSLTEDLEVIVQQRTSALRREQQRAETLLRIITELSASLDLDQILNSTLTVLSEFVDAKQITILISRPGEKKLHRLASVGYTVGTPERGSPTPFDVDQGLAGWIISHRESVLIDDVNQDDRWVKVPSGDKSPEPNILHRSAMGVPLMSGAEALGCLLLFHPVETHFSPDQLDLVKAAANQVSVAVNNAELYRLIRDQAEDLGTMLRNQQVETSRSNAILEAVADGVLVTDADRKITLFNESAEKILGIERSQILGKSLEAFIGLFGRAARSWMQTIQTWSQNPDTYETGDTYSEQINLEDGRVIAVRLAPVILRNDFLGTVSIFQDITHQVEVDRLKSEFVATVSHELRTPMTSIKGYVEILLMGAAGMLTEKQSHFLEIVQTNTERLSVLVNDLLDISQIEAGRVLISLQPTNLEDILEQAISVIKHRSEEESKPVLIEMDIQPNLPRVYGDGDRILQILNNLLDNAYQYNLPNGKIKVSMHQVEEEIQIDVEDTGLGIQPDEMPLIFERFFRGENPLVLGVSGTGLGLAIVKNLVEMHNGRIWLESDGVPGEGSTFSFTIPIYKHEMGKG